MVAGFRNFKLAIVNIAGVRLHKPYNTPLCIPYIVPLGSLDLGPMGLGHFRKGANFDASAKATAQGIFLAEPLHTRRAREAS